MRVLLTRARERSEKTARRLAAEGHEAIILPLMRYRDIDENVPGGRFDAIAFTSAEAVASLARRIDADPSLSGLRGLPAFCVGAATASACKTAGFGEVHSADGDAAALAELMARTSFAAQRPIVLYPAQPNRANDLGAMLPGLDVREFKAYHAEPFDPGQKAFVEALLGCDAVFLYSPRSASHFAELLLAHVESAFAKRLTLIAISEKTARAITDGRSGAAKEAGLSIAVAASPDENAMISLLAGGAGGNTAQRP